jgi:hypothetical protein
VWSLEKDGAVAATTQQSENLTTLLGGRAGAIDATIPPVAFTLGWLISHHSIGVGAAAALAAAIAIAGWRLRQGTKPRAVIIGVFGVCVSTLIALHTGRAADFFLIQVLSNAASALGWAISIMVRWPFLGLIVGAVLGQRTQWRRDPALLRGYSRASWVWVGQYMLRLVVFVPLWATNQVVALSAARVVLTWPLVAACLACSWWVLRRSLPAGHLGLRHIALPAEPSA